ncbi:MAG: hypothetical protein ACM3QW_02125 [Ignavibacteriales bacterium]
MAKFANNKIWIPALWIAFFTFTAGMILSLGLESVIRTVQSIAFSLSALLIVILLGIVSDAIGTAAAAADLVPFNAMASKKVQGAKQAVRIVHNADLVANLTADVVGDIAGTLSGAIGASIVYSLASKFSIGNTVILGGLMTSLIASLTVGGKAIGKTMAIRHSHSIIFKVAGVMEWWERLTGTELFSGRR